MKKKYITGNRIFMLLAIAYTCVLFILGCIACFFSYHQKKDEALSEINLTFQLMIQEYTDILDNFWQIYMPIFETSGNDFVSTTLTDYFIPGSNTALKPLEKRALTTALAQMMMRDDKIQWIALYSNDRAVNYILYQDGSNLSEIRPDFPYLAQLANNPKTMSVWGTTPVSDTAVTANTFAICGGIPYYMGSGNILVGYSVSPLEQICKNKIAALPSLNYRLTSNQQLLFDSSGSYEESGGCFPTETIQGLVHTHENQRFYVRSRVCGNNTSVVSYTVSWRELFFYAHSSTPLILLIVLFFYVISIILYSTMMKMITREVNIIRTGLVAIGENHLDYRIPMDFKQSGLPQIAESINLMTVRLKEHINRAYYYELRQKEAELSELQAKFNPHFLYNSLEMLCSRCYQYGDEETADLITQLAAIFRGFIGSQTFIPFQEELTYSKRYLTLFGARYGEKANVYFDIETELLQYGVIRNIFQPLIENYFVHGFDSQKEDNYILLRAKSLDEQTMLLTVEDNGYGMSDAEIEALNARFTEPVQLDTESYGLKNLHQRLSLFYGGNCGLKVVRHAEKGICIEMTLLKMTCAEYQKGKGEASAML